MGCLSPSLFASNSGVMLTPCRHCKTCLSSRVQDLSFLAQKELSYAYKRGLGASFVTLTYNMDSLPINQNGYSTLVKSDMVNYHKRLREYLAEDLPNLHYKHISCGEYGDDYGRPHMHSVFIGLSDVLADKYTRLAWHKDSRGLIDVQPLKSFRGVQYVCKYLSKSNPYGEIKRIYEFTGVQPPFLLHSQQIGRDWLEDNLYNIVADKFCYTYHGQKMLYPKSVREYVRKKLGVDTTKYVQDYIKSLNLPKGYTLDDYQAEQSYYKAYNAYLQQVDQLKADYPLFNVRLPKRLRNTHNDDLHLLAHLAIAC